MAVAAHLADANKAQQAEADALARREKANKGAHRMEEQCAEVESKVVTLKETLLEWKRKKLDADAELGTVCMCIVVIIL